MSLLDLPLKEQVPDTPNEPQTTEVLGEVEPSTPPQSGPEVHRSLGMGRVVPRTPVLQAAFLGQEALRRMLIWS